MKFGNPNLISSQKERIIADPGYFKQLLIDNEFKPDYIEIYVRSQEWNFKPPRLF